MANVLVGVTGSVAAIYTRELANDLAAAGFAVKVVATAASLHFFDPASLDRSQPGRNRELVVLDEDEWSSDGYRRGDPVLHIELRRWADLLLIAPLDANTLAKLAGGHADNCLTCVCRAWDRSRPVVLAPAMNTLMWEHPATARHFRQLAEDAGSEPPTNLPRDELLAWIDCHCPLLRVVAPISKKLACDDVGIGAMAGREEILTAVRAALARR
jgi:phosphopantothenoylcysteine decarboxylase